MINMYLNEVTKGREERIYQRNKTFLTNSHKKQTNHFQRLKNITSEDKKAALVEQNGQ